MAATETTVTTVTANDDQVVIGIEFGHGHVAVAVPKPLVDRELFAAVFRESVAEQLERAGYRGTDMIHAGSVAVGSDSPFETEADDDRPVSDSGPTTKYDTGGVDLSNHRHKEVGLRD